jgi:two-component system, OmpR family, alkaline phosphatase synthesis response regulator PhoP
MDSHVEVGAILLIDDDENSHALLKYHLERAGFQLVSAMDAQQAFSVIDEQSDLLAVFVDINLPRADIGWDLLNNLVKLKQTRLAGTPLVVFSVDDDKTRAKAAGADEHIVKPARPKEFVSLVKKFAARRTERKG